MAALKRAGLFEEEQELTTTDTIWQIQLPAPARQPDHLEDFELDGEMLDNNGKVTEEMRAKQRTARFWRQRIEGLPEDLKTTVRVFLFENTLYDCFGWEEGLLPPDVEESQRAVFDKLGSLSGLVSEEERAWLAYDRIGESLEDYSKRKKEMEALVTAETEAENQFRRSHPQYYPDW